MPPDSVWLLALRCIVCMHSLKVVLVVILLHDEPELLPELVLHLPVLLLRLLLRFGKGLLVRLLLLLLENRTIASGKRSFMLYMSWVGMEMLRCWVSINCTDWMRLIPSPALHH